MPRTIISPWVIGRWPCPQKQGSVVAGERYRTGSDIEIDHITAIQVDGEWMEIEPGSISSHNSGWTLGDRRSRDRVRAMDTPITSRNKEATYVLVSAITAIRTRQDAPGNLRA